MANPYSLSEQREWRRFPNHNRCEVQRLAYAFDDSDVAVGGVPEDTEGGFVGVAFIGGDGSGHAVKFNYDDSLVESVFVGFGGCAAGEDAAACRFECGAREFTVSRDCSGI